MYVAMYINGTNLYCLERYIALIGKIVPSCIPNNCFLFFCFLKTFNKIVLN